MASRAEHYREAERRLEDALDAEGGSDNERYLLGAASVHALLANAPGEVAAAPGEVPGAGGPSPRTVTFDITSPDDRHVITQALDDYEVKQTGLAADGDNKDKRTGWAAAARRFRDRAAEA
jgi:hypothetical protein